MGCGLAGVACSNTDMETLQARAVAAGGLAGGWWVSAGRWVSRGWLRGMVSMPYNQTRCS